MELRHAPLLTVAALLRSALGFTFSLLSIRAISADAFGYFSLVWSFCTAFLFVFTGVNTVVIARMAATRDSGGDAEWFTAGATLAAGGALGLMAVSAVVAGTGAFDGDLHVALVACPLILACQAVTQFSAASFEGRGRMLPAVVLPMLGTVAITIYLAVCLVSGHEIGGLRALLAAMLVVFGAEALVAVAAVGTVWARRGRLAWRSGALRTLLVGGTSTQAANTVSFLLDPWSKAVIATHLGTASVAIFDLAMKVGWALHAAFSASSRLFLQIPPTAQHRRLASLRTAADFMWAPAALVSAGVISIVPLVLSGWLRIEQTPLAIGMTMALACCSLMTASAPAYVSLIGFGDHGFIFRNQMILGASNVVMTPLLVPVLGLAGAFAGILLGTLLNFGLISRRLGVHMPGFGGFANLVRPFAARIALAIAVFAVASWTSIRALPWEVSAATAAAASVLLLREPLARAALRMLRPA